MYKTIINSKEIFSEDEYRFTIDCCQQIVDMFKDVTDDKKRVGEYVKYLTNFGHYNKKLRKEVLKKRERFSTAKIEKLNNQDLCEFFISGNGVCAQFAKALSLICALDSKMKASYTLLDLEVKGDPMGHAINIVQMGDEKYIVDISSAIHCKEGDYNAKKEDFLFVDLAKYIENMYKQKIIIRESHRNREDVYYSQSYIDLDKKDINAYYKLLNISTELINKEYRALVKPLWSISKEQKKELNLDN